MNANHFQTGWNGVVVDAGEIITGRKRLADETGLTQDEVRTALNHLKSTGYITIKTTNKYSIISFTDKENWTDDSDIFPNNSTNTLPIKSPTNPQQIPTERDLENIETKRLRESGTRKARFTPPTVKEVKAYCAEIGSSINAEYFIDYYEANGWRTGRNPMRDWRATVRNWTKREGGFQAASKASAVQKGFRPVPTQEEYLEGLDPSGFGWA